MNYLKAYCNLIRKAEKRGFTKKKAKEQGLYVEGHHTFPKSIFGKNKRIVYLTAREHYIAHVLLERIYLKRYGIKDQRTHKMICAHKAMGMSSNNNKNYINAYLYEKLKDRFIKILSERMKGTSYGIKGGNKCRDLKLGFFAMSEEEMQMQRSKAGKIAGKKNYELGLGIHGRTKEQMTEDGKKGVKTQKELGIGLYGVTFEQRSATGKKYGRENAKKLNSQKWKCTITGYITTSGPLTLYQRKRSIDTSNRIKL